MARCAMRRVCYPIYGARTALLRQPSKPPVGPATRHLQWRFVVEWSSRIPVRAQKFILLLILLGANLFLLWQFSPDRWPYLWPKPMIYIILGVAVALVALRMQGYWSKTLIIRVAGLILFFL